MSNSFPCPNCGANVPLKARACPHCGSDKETGWSTAATYLHLLPYDGDAAPEPLRARPWFRILTLCVAVIFSWGLLASLSVGLRYLRERESPLKPAPHERIG